MMVELIEEHDAVVVLLDGLDTATVINSVV